MEQIRVLISHLALCKQIKTIQESLGHDYNHLVVWQACLCYEVLCADPEKTNVISKCLGSERHKFYEEDVLLVLDEMFSDPGYARDLKKYAMKFAPNRNAHEQQHQLECLTKKRNEIRSGIMHRYMPKAIIRFFLGQELTPLEVILTSPIMVREFRLFSPDDAEIITRVYKKLTSFKNPGQCRHCLKERKCPIQCPKCKRVYFCSKRCEREDVMELKLSHDELECGLFCESKKDTKDPF
jgi:hypothetical protein